MFAHDHLFESPSTAAAIVVGIPANGQVSWHNEHGRTLKDVQYGQGPMDKKNPNDAPPPHTKATPVTLSKIFFHAPCFDGAAAAALAMSYLVTRRGWTPPELVPVTYHNDDWWLRQDLSGHTAVVDFMYQPQAKFWVDHHGSTFKETTVSGEMRDHYLASKADPTRTLVYDPSYPSGTKLLWDFIKGDVDDHDRFAELVRWANLTDSAAYESPHQAVFGDEPALRIASSLGSSLTDGHIVNLVGLLATRSLDDIAEMPIVADRFSLNRPRVERGLAMLDSAMSVEGVVGRAIVSPTENESIPKFGGFLLHPEIRYMVSLIHESKGHRVYASRNPWNGETKIHLGNLFETYGGGGHFGVGAMMHEPESRETAERMYHEVLNHIEREDGS